MSCMPPAFVWDRTQASGFVARRANHCTTEAQGLTLNLPFKQMMIFMTLLFTGRCHWLCIQLLCMEDRFVSTYKKKRENCIDTKISHNETAESSNHQSKGC